MGTYNIIIFLLLGIFSWEDPEEREVALTCLFLNWKCFKMLYILFQNFKNTQVGNVELILCLIVLRLLGLHWCDHNIKDLSHVVLHKWNYWYSLTCLGLYCNYNVHLSVCYTFWNSFLSFYWRESLDIWYIAFACWLVSCLPFSGSSPI